MNAGDPSHHAAVRAFLAALELEEDDAPDLRIHPDDSMLAFGERLTCGVGEQALLEYLRSGHHAWGVSRRLLRRVHRARFPDRAPERVLDFGAGHGRVTRFLVRGLSGDQPAEPGDDRSSARIRATEADADAVDFLQDAFPGVDARRTPLDPAAADGDLLPDGVHDLILALSVLTHLPQHSFDAWLERWLRALAVEGGVLAFTTLGPSALLPGRAMPASGFHFEAMSESKVLELSDYGTAWVAPARVARLVDEITGGMARWRHLERGLWHLQDLWIVTLDPLLDLDDPDDPRDQALDAPAGAVELCRAQDGGRSLRVAGWATGGRRPARRARIELWLEAEEAHDVDDGASGDSDEHGSWRKVAETETAADRPDALRALGLASGDAPAGFDLRWSAEEPLDPAQALRVDAVDPATGHRQVLHAGGVESGDLYLRLRQATRRADELRAQVEIFEASGFGRLRRRWMAWKERLRGRRTREPGPDSNRDAKPDAS